MITMNDIKLDRPEGKCNQPAMQGTTAYAVVQGRVRSITTIKSCYWIKWLG